MFADLLPIGSVVLLKNGMHKVMIIGIKPLRAEEPEVVYDYFAVMYPEGYLGGRTCFIFNHEDINDVVFRGYDNPERKAFMDYLDKAAQDQRVKK